MNIKNSAITRCSPTEDTPSYLYSCVVEDRGVEYDFTGQNSLVFPDCLDGVGKSRCKQYIDEIMANIMAYKFQKMVQESTVWPEYLLRGRTLPVEPDLLGLTPSALHCVVTLAVGKDGQALLDVSGPLFAAYAERIGADYRPIVLTQSTYPAAEKFRLKEYLEYYDRVIFFDAGTVLMPDLESLFEVVGESSVGGHDDLRYCGGDDAYRSSLDGAMSSQDCFRGAAAPAFALNTDVLVLSREHGVLFDPPAGPLPNGPMTERHWINLNAMKNGVPLHRLSRRHNWQWGIDRQCPGGDAGGVKVWNSAGHADPGERLAWMSAKAALAQAASSSLNHSAARRS